MTMATNTDITEIKADIREIKTAVEAISKGTEANTKAVEAISKGTEANTKAISDLTTSVSGLREEMRVGFANVDTKFARLDGKIDTAEAKLDGKIDKIDERTKLGFWGFILRGTVLALILIVIKYLLPMLPAELPRL
jgi:methyl-accepting chemotaxis protein